MVVVPNFHFNTEFIGKGSVIEQLHSVKISLIGKDYTQNVVYISKLYPRKILNLES